MRQAQCVLWLLWKIKSKLSNGLRLEKMKHTMNNICGNKDTISVVIPFYSGRRWLNEALDSVLAQTLLPDEIIVVNDGSNENIDSLISKFKDEVKFVYQDNRGAASARNHGIKLSTGKYIAFLDSDDLWRPQKLEIQMKYMKDNNLFWSHCPYEVFDDHTRRIIKRIDNLETAGIMFPRLLARCKIGTPCVMIKRECLTDKRMLFNEKMRQGQDYCFWNVLGRKYKLGNVGESLVLVRDHSSNIANNVLAQLRTKSMMYDYLIEHYDYFGQVSALLKLAFLLSKFGYNISERVQNKKIQKLISYVFYIVPWMLFHLYYRFADNRNN